MIGHTIGWRQPVFIGVPLLTAALVGTVIFYRSTETPALTQKDRVVLSAVINRTGDTMFDDTLGEALALQLRQSPFLNLVPEQQVQATLRLMGRDPMTPITADVGREVCQRAGAKALLGGTIAMLGSSYVITLNAQDCIEGKVLAEEQAQASTKESVLSSMGTAASAFREKLGESLASIQRYDSKIEEATTSSLEALKAYSQGLRTRRTTGDFDSVPFFRHAIDLDPNFAPAYARLGTVYNNLGQGDEARKMTTRAYELREKVSEQERLYIEARYYSSVENNIQKALDTYKVWLGTYPYDYTALTNAALLHKNQGDRAEAIRKLELATKVAPDQPLAWTNLGQTYFEGGQYADAKRVYETAVRLQDSTSSRIGLYQTAVLMGDLATAEQQAMAVHGRRDEVDMVAIRLHAATYRGRFKEAAELANEFQTRTIALSKPQGAGSAVMSLAISEAAVGLIDEAKARVEKAEADGILGPSENDDKAVVAALTKDLATIRATQAKGKEEPVTFKGFATDEVSIWSLAKFQSGDWASAAKGFDFLVSDQARPGLSATRPWSWLMRGRAYAHLGNKEEARKSYQKFFNIFKDADPDLPLLLEARGEFAKLAS